MKSYDLSRRWFDFCFENTDIVRPAHSALYFFAMEHCNRLGWKDKFSFSTEMAKDATGIKSYNTYISTLNDLVDWGFIEMIQKSRNQYSANIIALSKNDKATNKALDKAIIKHLTEHDESTVQSTCESIDSIIKPLTINQETKNQETITPNGVSDSDESEPAIRYSKIEKTKAGIYEYLKTRPKELQPYIDYWNIFAEENGKATVATLSDKRKQKLKVRIREEPFILNDILRKAKDSELLRTSKWFAFDWLIANDTNYLKVLEGNYDNILSEENSKIDHDERRTGPDWRILAKI